jgi:hypothetical protein
MRHKRGMNACEVFVLKKEGCLVGRQPSLAFDNSDGKTPFEY